MKTEGMIGGEEHSGSREGSSQTYRSASKVPEQGHFDRRDQDLECLRRLVRNMELEVLDRHRRRNQGESPVGSVSVGGSRGKASYQSDSRQSGKDHGISLTGIQSSLSSIDMGVRQWMP